MVPIHKEHDYETGLLILGIPGSEMIRISTSLVRGRLPRDVIDVIIVNADRIEGVHPDRYPWAGQTSDEISGGLIDKSIDCGEIWRDAASYVRGKFGKEMPRICDVAAGYPQALTNLFEIYALAKYHDVSKLPTASRGLPTMLRAQSELRPKSKTVA